MKKIIKNNFSSFYLYIRSIYRYIISTYYSLKPRKSYPKSLSSIYKRYTGKDLIWEEIETYGEKMQWSKLYEQNNLKSYLTDKYLVRRWVESKIGKDYLIPLLGVWETFEEIDFDELPNQFVLKTNHGSGTNIIVKDKRELNIRKAKRLFNIWLKTNYAFTGGFELQYKDIKPKIIAEEYITDQNNQLEDYKFLCFNGEVHYFWVNIDKDSSLKRNIYDTDWNLQNFKIDIYPNSEEPIEPPENFKKMVEIAKKLCQGFSHVRVDLYNCDGKIYFGEMTFTSGSGYRKITPSSYDKYLGNLWKL